MDKRTEHRPGAPRLLSPSIVFGTVLIVVYGLILIAPPADQDDAQSALASTRERSAPIPTGSLRTAPISAQRTAPPPPLTEAEEPAQTWRPAEGSPVLLIDPERWGSTFAPTIDTLTRQLRIVPHLADLTEDQIRIAWETPGFQEAWRLNREHMAFRQFLSGYKAREYARWESGLPSIALETEVQPVVSFIAAFPNPGKVWSALNAYSADVINAIHGSGEHIHEQDVVPTHWGLFGEVLEQAQAATALVDLTLEKL